MPSLPCVVAGTMVKARWYDPRTGNWRAAGEFAATDVREFSPRAAKKTTGRSSWMLLGET